MSQIKTMSSEGRELLDRAAQALYDERRVPYMLGPYHALSEVDKRTYQAEAAVVIKEVANWMKDQNWDDGYRFRNIASSLEA